MEVTETTQLTPSEAKVATGDAPGQKPNGPKCTAVGRIISIESDNVIDVFKLIANAVQTTCNTTAYPGTIAVLCASVTTLHVLEHWLQCAKFPVEIVTTTTSKFEELPAPTTTRCAFIAVADGNEAGAFAASMPSTIFYAYLTPLVTTEEKAKALFEGDQPTVPPLELATTLANLQFSVVPGHIPGRLPPTFA